MGKLEIRHRRTEHIRIHRPAVLDEPGQWLRLPNVLGWIYKETVFAGFADVARAELRWKVRNRHRLGLQIRLQHGQLLFQVPTHFLLECEQRLTDISLLHPRRRFAELSDETANLLHLLTDNSFLRIPGRRTLIPHLKSNALQGGAKA